MGSSSGHLLPDLPTLPPPGNLLSRDPGGGRGGHPPRSGRLCLERDDAAPTDAVLTAQELRRGMGPRAGAPHTPGGDHSWALVRANKARNLWCPRPREPRYHQVAGRAGARAITSLHTPHRAQPRAARTTKDSLPFPTVPAEPILPLQNPNLVMDENSALPPNLFQPSRAEPPSWLSHEDRALPRIPPSWGISAPCWPLSEDVPGPAHTSPGQTASRAVAVPGGTGRCVRRRWGSPQHGARRSLGLRAERSGRRGSRLLPQGRAMLRRQRHETK